MRQQHLFELYFTTCTIKDWKHLLKPDKYKQIIVNSLTYLAAEGNCWIYGFVIMPNHFHIIWGMKHENSLKKIQQRLLKFTAQSIKFDLIENHPNVLEIFKTNRKDSEYQFYKDRPLSIPIYTEEVFVQKLNYIHLNPCQEKWKLATNEIEYAWSSASFYGKKDTRFSFLIHFWNDNQE
jgi:putative transposase